MVEYTQGEVRGAKPIAGKPTATVQRPRSAVSSLEHAIIGNIVPDFPLINKSFNLSYSGHDL
jgi:Ni,Fe-hydrogenase III large subunit